MDKYRRGLLMEVAVITVVLVSTTGILNSLQKIPFVAKYYGVIFALMFLYVPVAVMQKRGRDLNFLDRKVSFYMRSLAAYIIASLIVFPLFIAGAHFWEKEICNAQGPVFVMLPDMPKIVAYQFIMVALPEEFFFRGYMQSALNQVFPKRWRLLGADLGIAWILTAAIFAACHSVVAYQWWHFAIFFPALLFGYLRERTGAITAPILFHGTANVAMNWIVMMYR